MTFESFAVGDVWRSTPRPVTDQDIADVIRLGGDHHPLHTDDDAARQRGFDGAIAPAAIVPLIAGGLWSQMGAVQDSIIAAVSESWNYREPVRADDVLTLTATIVATRPSRSGNRGTVTRHNELRRQDDVLVADGESVMLLKADPEARHDPARDVGTVAWGQLVAETLNENAEFASAVASWDGTIGVRFAAEEVHLRIYRGRIIDVTKRTPLGATFVLNATPRTWAEILTGPPIEFAARQLQGQFSVSGDPYEYLRLSKALALLIEAARGIAGDETKENGR